MTTIDHREKEVLSVDKDAGETPDFADASEHPSLRIPFSVAIDGRAYEGVTLSMVGARIAGIAAANWAGASKLALFRFNFNGFSLSLPIDVVVASSDSETGAIALRFRDPTGQHMPQIRYLLNCWIAGDHVSLNGLIGLPSVREKENTSTSEAVRRPGSAALARIVGTLSVGLASIALILFTATALNNRLYVTEVNAPALVQRQGLTMKATASGQIDFINPSAPSGKPAYSILASSGVAVTVSMPCDCEVQTTGIERGATVLVGQPILNVNKHGAPLVVQSSLTGPELRRLAGGATAQIETRDGRKVDANVLVDRAGAPTGELLPVTLVPIESLPDVPPGTPVVVRLDGSPGWVRAMTNSLSYFRGTK
ncbi:hypothetical protein [Rhizobium sp. LjRoot258]|uniref:hypothetical protein n=1 Tax=Rhizobium sp. LjRoot258 TaxID=3342299 RepID=UPI003ECCA429